MQYRTEKDSLGTKSVPDQAYYGIHTQRALENFPLGSRRVPMNLITAIVRVKKAAAEANRDLGYLSDEKAGAIVRACEEILAGDLAQEFPLTVLQGGAGTSTNMNVNEVIANRAGEILGDVRGSYQKVHPLDHVNLHQSTNDVYPTAVKVAAILALRELSASAALLQGALQRKEKEFAGIVKIGRTEMQEALPLTLGAEFAAWAEAVGRDRWRTFKCEERLRVVNIGGTAIGTGLGAPREYIFLVIEKLRAGTGLGLSRAENLPGETAHADSFVEVSGILKAHAVNLIKIANDLRILNALGEIHLAALQAGSSIMPGKVNPVIPEALMQAGFQVLSNDVLIAETASRGTLQINEFLPLLGTALLESIGILTDADRLLAGHIASVQADEKRCRYYLDRSRMIVTAFVPVIGYGRAEALLKEFDSSGEEDLRAFLGQRLGQDVVDQTLSAQNLMSLGFKRQG